MAWLWKIKAESTHEDARQALARAERDHDMVMSRWPLIRALVDELREAREVNHFHERIRAAMGAR